MQIVLTLDDQHSYIKRKKYMTSRSQHTLVINQKFYTEHSRRIVEYTYPAKFIGKDIIADQPKQD